MAKMLDLTNQKFGKLTVIKFEKKLGKHIRWECICECGKTTYSYTTNLIRGKSKSCGCSGFTKATERLKPYFRHNMKPEGYGSCGYLRNRYIQGAKVRSLVFELTTEQFMNITSQNCHYCGREPKQVIKGPRTNGVYIYNGIDRKDSSIGYTLENSLPCCSFCNYAKHDYSYEDYQEWINNLVKHKNG